MIKTGANNLSTYLQGKMKNSKSMSVPQRVAYAVGATAKLAGKRNSQAPYPAVEKQVKAGIRQLQ